MDWRITWSKRAQQDLAELFAWIAKDAPDNCQRVARKIREKIKMIATHPNAGHRLTKYKNRRVKYVLVFKYRVFYRIDDEHLIILRIVHGARKFPKLFQNN